MPRREILKQVQDDRLYKLRIITKGRAANKKRVFNEKYALYNNYNNYKIII